MANAVSFKMRWEDPTVLQRYAALSRHTPAEIVNRKAYRIIQKAIWYTHKADIDKMRQELGESKAMELHRVKSGKRFSHAKKNIKSFFGAGAGNQGAPLLAMIIQARASHGGKPSPWKGVARSIGAAKMLAAMRLVWNARARSIAFIKSGWIEARDIYKALAKGGGGGLPPSEGAGIGGLKRIGAPKGGGTPAIDGIWRARAVFWNSASAKRDHKEAVFEYGAPALLRGFEEEELDTMQEVERRLKERAAGCGIRTG